MPVQLTPRRVYPGMASDVNESATGAAGTSPGYYAATGAAAAPVGVGGVLVVGGGGAAPPGTGPPHGAHPPPRPPLPQPTDLAFSSAVEDLLVVFPEHLLASSPHIQAYALDILARWGRWTRKGRAPALCFEAACAGAERFLARCGWEPDRHTAKIDAVLARVLSGLVVEAVEPGAGGAVREKAIGILADEFLARARNPRVVQGAKRRVRIRKGITKGARSRPFPRLPDDAGSTSDPGAPPPVPPPHGSSPPHHPAHEASGLPAPTATASHGPGRYVADPIERTQSASPGVSGPRDVRASPGQPAGILISPRQASAASSAAARALTSNLAPGPPPPPPPPPTESRRPSFPDVVPPRRSSAGSEETRHLPPTPLSAAPPQTAPHPPNAMPLGHPPLVATSSPPSTLYGYPAGHDPFAPGPPGGGSMPMYAGSAGGHPGSVLPSGGGGTGLPGPLTRLSDANRASSSGGSIPQRAASHSYRSVGPVGSASGSASGNASDGSELDYMGSYYSSILGDAPGMPEALPANTISLGMGVGGLRRPSAIAVASSSANGGMGHGGGNGNGIGSAHGPSFRMPPRTNSTAGAGEMHDYEPMAQQLVHPPSHGPPLPPVRRAPPTLGMSLGSSGVMGSSVPASMPLYDEKRPDGLHSVMEEYASSHGSLDYA
ncbi:hypothetical protein CXG81DRAFT_16307 [Caulochytrium protostelioides]|uniref:Uncharacterized protein n=1 Tax=Caulochytrium protostelioides TaxID=1555241 RepID=A0A4V1IVK1_9FUNG|nr:hypothetical protein CXG81DRAFT_16307 [Caulochytrium protostelioides]|eukprot:RKP04339.1 hypothetical protein CXG81DRAFT_16307 [Caulochytrium protostelioides]